MKLLPVALAITALWVSFSAAKTYYVSKTGNNTSGNGSEGAPWFTIQKAADMAAAGDTVNVKAGTYSDNVSPQNSGTATKRIIYQPYGSDKVIITGGFNITKDYITVQGFEFSGCSIMFGFQAPGGTHCRILDNYIHNSGVFGLFIHGSYHIIRGNRISNNGSSWGGQITTGWGSGPDPAHHIVIEYNEVSDGEGNGEDLMQYLGHDILVRGNYFHHLGDNGRHNDIYQSGGGDYNIWMINNRFEHLRGVQYFMPGPSGDQDHTWRGNLFWGGIGWGFNGAPEGMRVMHNTFNVTSGWGVNACGKAYNNIFSSPGSDGHNGDPLDYNCVYPAPCCATQGPNDLWDVDPLFVNVEDHDYQLQNTSPCIDAGTFPATTTSAGSGTELPVDDARIFVDGFGIADGDLIQLEGQTQTARITSINYSTRVLTLDRSLTWTNGQGVSVPYSGSAPDMGAFEHGLATNIPQRPGREYAPAPETRPGLVRPGNRIPVSQYVKVYDICGRPVGSPAFNSNGVYFFTQDKPQVINKRVILVK